VGSACCNNDDLRVLHLTCIVLQIELDFREHNRRSSAGFFGLQGRYSFVGAQPALEIMASGNSVTLLNHETQERGVSQEEDPLEMVVAISRKWRPVPTEGLPRVFTGGWSGYCGYDTVRYVYGGACSSHPVKGCLFTPNIRSLRRGDH